MKYGQYITKNKQLLMISLSQDNLHKKTLLSFFLLYNYSLIIMSDVHRNGLHHFQFVVVEGLLSDYIYFYLKLAQTK